MIQLKGNALYLLFSGKVSRGSLLHIGDLYRFAGLIFAGVCDRAHYTCLFHVFEFRGLSIVRKNRENWAP